MCVNVNAIDYVNDRTENRNIFLCAMNFIIGSSVYEIFRNAICAFFTPARDFQTVAYI